MQELIKVLPLVALPIVVILWFRRYQQVTREGFQFKPWIIRVLISLVLLLIIIAISHFHNSGQ